MNYITLLGLIGTFVGVTRALPQFLRVIHSKKANGVSPDSAATSSVVSFGWAAYGLMTAQLFITLAAGVSGTIFALIAILSIRFGRKIKEFRIAPAWLILMLVCGYGFGTTGLGILLPVSVLASTLPQVLVAYRESNLTDLSLGTWFLNFSDGLIWCTYGLIQDDVFLLLATSLQMATSAMIILLKLIKKYRYSHSPMPY